MINKQKQQELLARLDQYKDASQEERQYQLELAIRDLCEGMPEEEIQNVLLLVDMLFNQWAKEAIHAALREDAIYPENVVGSEQKVPKVLN
jgi:hypothetical protein